MCERVTHFSNHLCIACLSGSVRCQAEQWLYHYSKHYADLWSRGMPRIVEEEGEENKKNKIEICVQSDSVTGARCCSCSTFFPLQRKHTLIQTIWEATRKCQNIALAWFVTVCLVLDCQNWVSLPLKICSKVSPWRVEILWHNRMWNFPSCCNCTKQKLTNEPDVNGFALLAPVLKLMVYSLQIVSVSVPHVGVIKSAYTHRDNSLITKDMTQSVNMLNHVFHRMVPDNFIRFISTWLRTFLIGPLFTSLLQLLVALSYESIPTRYVPHPCLSSILLRLRWQKTSSRAVQLSSLMMAEWGA